MKRKIVFIGASTGGPSRIKEIISSLSHVSCTIIVALHMKEEILPFFIENLQESSKVKVKTTPCKDMFEEPAVIVCSRSSEISLDSSRYKITHNDTQQHYTPDINKLLVSFSKYSYDFDVTVFILTGIGDDGVDGASVLKNSGARVVVESENSCAVFGMPRVAIERGIVDKIKNMEQIISHIKELA